jgi:two-component system sensor histidine kinase KdpD
MRCIAARALPYGVTIGVLAMLTAGLAPLFEEEHIAVASMLFLLVTLVVAARWGYGPGFATAVLGNLLVNFFFVPPLHRLHVNSAADIGGLAVFLAVAFVGAFMLSRLREQARRAVKHEAETAVLLRATREVAHAETPRQALDRLSEVIARAAGARGCAILAGEPPAIVGATLDEQSTSAPTRDEAALIRETLRTGEFARYSPARSGPRTTLFVPVPGSTPGALRLWGVEPDADVHSELFQALTNEVRATLERSRLARVAGRAAELERADSLKTALLSSVSHDLRSPLTAVKAAVSSLRDRSVTWAEEDREAFEETIETQTDRLTKTVANLLEMSRLEGGAARPHLEAVELGPLLEEAALATRSTTAGRTVTHCAPPGAWVKTDYGLLMQALTNLIENAARYSTPGGPIRLEATTNPGRALIEVKDSGPGIPEQELPHVFEKFYRGKSALQESGSGLGLALVKALVELAGGTVSARSDGGATFTISLPATGGPR